MRGRGALAAAIGALLLIPAIATAAAPPPGAAISDNLEFVDARSGRGRHHRGQVRRGPRQEGPRRHRPLRLQDVQRQRSRRTRCCSTSSCPHDLAAVGYWQNEDMELDTQRKLIIGALDPRHTRGSADSRVPARRQHNASRAARAASTSSRTPIRANMRQIGDFVSLPSGHTSSCIQDCKYIWTGGPARRADQDWLGTIISPVCRPDHAPEPPDRRRPADLGHRPREPVATRRCPTSRSTCGATTATRTTRTTSTRTSAGSRGSPAAAASAATPPRAGIVTRTRTACARRRRSTRSSWPAAACVPAPARAACDASCTTPAGRPTARSGRRA